VAIAASAISQREPHRFYVRLAAGCAVVTLFSFVPTYWQPLITGQLDGGAPALHVHAFLFSLWPLLFLAQTSLVATSRMASHRALGMVGAGLAVAMMSSGLWVTAYSINVQSALGYPFEARGFAITSFTKVLFFGTCVALAISQVSKPNVHKRLMVLAMLPHVHTALPRILYALFAPPGSPQRPGLGEPPPTLVSVPGAVVIDLLMLALLIYDRRATGRFHPGYVIGGIAFVAIQILRVPARSTEAWQSVASWLAQFA
jgi:hypothetical protein